MLAVIANTEDAAGYRRPVTFFNEQLYPLVGVGSVDALARLRAKAVAAGWLHYDKGAKGKAARYWVTIPPQAEGWDDGPTDEQPDDYSSADSRKNPRGKCGSNREECAEHSSLTLPQEKTPLPPKGGVGELNGLAEGTSAISVLAALADCTGMDPVTAERALRRTATRLIQADPPYTPNEIAEFGRRVLEFCPWLTKQGRHQPSLREVEKYIRGVRLKPKKPPNKKMPTREMVEHCRRTGREVPPALLAHYGLTETAP